MTRILALLAMLVLAIPASAQTVVPVPRDAAPALALTVPAVPRISAGHAAALATGMFAGAVVGSVLINGGAFAALIGTATGAVLGNWYWTEYVEPQD